MMKRIITNSRNIVSHLGERTAAAVHQLEEEMVRKHKGCFRHYSSLDILNAVLAFADILRDEGGYCEASMWLDDLHRPLSYSEAEAFRSGNLVVRLGGLEEEEVLTRYFWELTATVTEGEDLPAWAVAMIDEEMPHFHHSLTNHCNKWASSLSQRTLSPLLPAPAKKRGRRVYNIIAYVQDMTDSSLLDEKAIFESVSQTSVEEAGEQANIRDDSPAGDARSFTQEEIGMLGIKVNAEPIMQLIEKYKPRFTNATDWLIPYCTLRQRRNIPDEAKAYVTAVNEIYNADVNYSNFSKQLQKYGTDIENWDSRDKRIQERQRKAFDFLEDLRKIKK